MQEVLDATKLAALHLIVAYTVYLHCALRGSARELRYASCARPKRGPGVSN
jgi:hypothetical protein